MRISDWSSNVCSSDLVLFYTRLFETAPEVKPLFKGDIKEQGRKLMATIGLAVSSLDRLPQLVPVVQDLGRKHAGYGVRDDHYDAVGAALLWTLEQRSEEHTSELQSLMRISYAVFCLKK